MDRDGGPVPRDRRVDRLIVHFDLPRPNRAFRGKKREGVAGPDRAAPEGPGHDRADPLDGEDAVDREARGAACLAAFDRGSGAIEGLEKHLGPVAGGRGNRNDRRTAQGGPIEEGPDLGRGGANPLRRRKVRLGERNHAARHAQEVDDREMLARLRLDALVGRDDEEDEVDAGRAGEHVLDEPFVAGNVDDGDPAAGGERQVREAEIDRDPALLLFLQPVGIDSGESADERGLAVVDVPRGADHDGAHGRIEGVSP